MDKAGCAIVACIDSGLELIGTGSELNEVIDSARARPGVDANSAIVAVPAWFNDEQRTRIRDRVRRAGVDSVRVVNEPVAIALAYGDDQAPIPRRSLIMSVSNSGSFDVTVLSCEEQSVEIVATNGIPELAPELIADADRLFVAIEPIVNRALADGEMQAGELEAIILGGASAFLWPARARIEAKWGQKPVEPPEPEIAVAKGAAILGRDLARAVPAPAADAASPPKSGCLSLIVVAVLLASLPLMLL